MPVTSACKRVMLDCSWVTRFHSGLECTGSVPETTVSQAEVTKLDCIRGCTRYLAGKIPLRRESFPYQQVTMHPGKSEFHLVSMESCAEIPYCCLDSHQPLQIFQVLHNHHHTYTKLGTKQCKLHQYAII